MVMPMQQDVPQGTSNYTEDTSGTQPVDSNKVGMLNKKQQQRIISWGQQQFTSIKNARVRMERQWYMNLLFYAGRQNVVLRSGQNLFQSTTGAFYVPPAPYYRVRLVINRIRPIIRTEVSKLTSQKPTAYVIPATSDDSDLFAAQAGEQIWESIYRSKKLPRVFRSAIWWNQICGLSFIRSIWNPDAIDKASDQMGDLEYKAVSPFNMFIPDFMEENLEDQPYLIYAQMYTADQAKLMFPNTQINQNSDGNYQLIERYWLDAVGAENKENRKGVLAMEFWVKPGKIEMFPNGAVFIIVGESLVHFQEEWPFEHGEYPFSKLSHIPTGKFYTESTIVDLIPPQREYNRTRSQVIEAKNKMAKPQLLAEEGAVDPTMITTEPGQVIEYKMGYGKPEPLQMQPLPNYVLQELDRNLQDMEDISGQHAVSNGQVPPGVTAATAINYLQESDDSILSYTYSSIEEAYERVAAQTLSYVQQFWDTPRTVKITGNDEFFDTLVFKGAQLNGNTDIRIEAGSALPISKSAKQAFIMDMMKMGFIEPVDGLEVMEMGGISKIYENIQVDVRQAQRENLRLAKIDDATFQQFAQGGMESNIVPVNTWDNHGIHIQTHDKYRKGQQYDQLSDAAKQAFEIHVQMHKLAQASAMTGENVMEMMKPENMALMQPPDGSGGGNQFTTANEAQSAETGNPSNGGTSNSGSSGTSS